MQSHRRRFARPWLIGISLSVLTACGSGDGTGPPPGDDDLAQQVATGERAKAASVEFEQLWAAGDPDPIGKLVASLEADPDIDRVRRFDEDATVIATLTNDISFSLAAAEKNRAEWELVPGAGSSVSPGGAGRTHTAGSLSAAAPPIVCDPTTFPQSKKACIVNLFADELQPDIGSIQGSLERAGFEVSSLSLNSPQHITQLQEQLSGCGVLYISSHGTLNQDQNYPVNPETNQRDPTLGPGKVGNHVVTQIEVGGSEVAMRNLLGDDYPKFIGFTARNGKSYWTLSPEFFASVQYTNNPFIFIDACSSNSPLPEADKAAGGRELREAFKTKGAGAFVGWRGPINGGISKEAAPLLFDALAPEVVVDAVTVEASPANPGAGQPYTPIATVTPAQAGVEVSLTVRGSDFFERDETGFTGANGQVFFTEVPGGQAQVTDIITVAVGGANDSQTAHNILQNNELLKQAYRLKQLGALPGVSINKLLLDAQTTKFNLVCNNNKLTDAETVVKFQ